MDLMEPPDVVAQIRQIYLRTGYAELVGGEAAFDAGLADMKAGVLVVAAELVNAGQLGVDLADAVFDTHRFPHTASLHGTLADALVGNVPGEMLPWIRRILAMGPLPECPDIVRAVAALAERAPNPFHRVLARLALFEMLCLTQRLLLRASGVHLEALNGRLRDIEVIAEENVEAVCALTTLDQGILAVEDPAAVLAGMVATRLSRHVETLRDELARLAGEVHEVLRLRKRFMEVLDGIDPTDAVIILNGAEDVTGEERLAPDQLRVLHPILLGNLSDEAIYQRHARSRSRMRRKHDASVSLIDLILAASEVQR